MVDLCRPDAILWRGSQASGSLQGAAAAAKGCAATLASCWSGSIAGANIMPAALWTCVGQMLYLGGEAKHLGHIRALLLLLLLLKAVLPSLLLAGQYS